MILNGCGCNPRTSLTISRSCMIFKKGASKDGLKFDTDAVVGGVSQAKPSVALMFMASSLETPKVPATVTADSARLWMHLKSCIPQLPNIV